MQETLDMIYQRSIDGSLNGINVYEVILSKENILLAYRNLKTNKGSKTSGTDKTTIEDIKKLTIDDLIETIRSKVNNYIPDTVRRVYIPKGYGEGRRPLGIPTIWDRIIQQMFKQVVEPIVEAKYHNHSYGFRPNRSTHHAMARCQFLVNKSKLYHVVDIDIKSFFDEINHHKLLQQLYTLGITDSRILTIISKMLKAPIDGVGIPKKGTPQGGVLSTLLANVVLNELDWWISSQWETNPIKERYKQSYNGYAVMKKTNMKEMYIVRYADDLKVFTRTRNEAKRVQMALIDFLKKRLGLEVSKEKSKITNLKRNKSNFLGFDIKAIKKGKGHVARTNINKKRKGRIRNTLKSRIKDIQSKPTRESVEKYNATVMGIQNYFQYATCVNKDLAEINYSLQSTLRNRLKINMKYGLPERPNTTYKKRYKNKFKTYQLQDTMLYPLADIQTRNVVGFTQTICNYTKFGRERTHKGIPTIIQNVINEMVANDETAGYSVEYYDNRISRYSMQRGKCAITGMLLQRQEIYCHQKVPKHLNGDDSFNNLVIVHIGIKELLQTKDKEVIRKCLKIFNLENEQLIKINKLREKCNLPSIN